MLSFIIVIITVRVITIFYQHVLCEQIREQQMPGNCPPLPVLVDEAQLTTSRPGAHVCMSLVQSQYVG